MDNGVVKPTEAGGSGIDASLRERAARAVPGGMWGHMNAASLPPAFPQYFSRGEGARVWDADGREYIDFICGFGPILLGHGDEEVDAAAEAAGGGGALLNGPTASMVDLAEALVDTVPAADWAMFQKNGADATTACVTIARAGTGRRKILVARGAYHGAVPWCSPSLAGVTAEDRAHLIHYDYNDAESVESAVETAGDDLAGILVSAFRHDARRDQETPTATFAAAVRAACDWAGAALILDDVRAGFRIDIGGSWEPLGVRPDLSAWSKAIANGWPLAAVTGADRFRDAAAKVFVTGSFWCAPAPMAAAAVTLRRLRETDAIARMARMGERLRAGLASAAADVGIGLRQTGPAQMPMVLFDDDKDFRKAFLFTTETLRRGVYFHPWHNMFVSAAHAEIDIDQAIAAARPALDAVACRFG